MSTIGRMSGHRALVGIMVTGLLAASVGACSAEPEPNAGVPGALSVVATTTIVGDIVGRVGGDSIDLTVLLPVGADPHGYEPKPDDVAAVAEADLVFVSGLGLEEFLTPIIENAGGGAAVVELSDGIQAIHLGEQHAHDSADEAGAGGDTHADPGGDGTTADPDPHVWLDPTNVIVWADNAADALSERDAQNAATYRSNADELRSELAGLDDWILEQVAAVPSAQRRLVSDHRTFGYFANRYGFEQVGTLLPGLSTMSEPSAAEMAELEDAIVELGVPAILVGSAMNPDLARRVADDTGTEIVTVYTGSLSEPNGPAGDYAALMRYNVAAIVEALQ